VAWGYDGYGECEAPEPNAGYFAIAAGDCYSLGLRAPGGPAQVPELSGALTLRIDSVRPNPFSPGTTIVFELPRASDGTLSVFDVAGRLVRTLWRGALPAGSHRVGWDGLDEGARTLPSGVYLMRLEAGSGAARVAKVILTR
jgi:hypothetical protein